jgi:alkylhydroperoxidase family enzyme
MKRRQQIEYQEASAEVQALYDEIAETMGTPEALNVFKALGNNPHVLRAVWSMVKGTIAEGEIPALLKQLILFKISVVAGNEYCKTVHGHDALNLDSTLTYDDLMALANGTCAKLPPSFQVAIDLVSRAALEPKGVAEDEFDFEEQLLDEGFSESEIDELLGLGMLAVMLNQLTDTYEVPAQASLSGDQAAEA